MSGELTAPIPTWPPAFNNMSPLPSVSIVMSPLLASTISILPEFVPPFVFNNKLLASSVVIVPLTDNVPFTSKLSLIVIADESEDVIIPSAISKLVITTLPVPLGVSFKS